jgi:hypothetical protein
VNNVKILDPKELLILRFKATAKQPEYVLFKMSKAMLRLHWRLMIAF